MSEIPESLKYSRSHEWIRVEEDGTVVVGITHHAQDLLGDMVFIELPEPGRRLAAEEECAVVESVKAASDIYAPVAGEVIACNHAVEETPELVNQEPYTGGWLFRMTPDTLDDVERLLDAAAYATEIAEG